MSPATDTAGPMTASPAEAEAPALTVQSDDRPADALTSYDWGPIALGISLAGGAYPLIFVAFYAVLGCLAVGYGLLTGDFADPSELIGLIFIPFMFAVFTVYAVLAGIVWAALVSTLTLPVVFLFVRSLQLSGSILWLGAFCGGLAGFIAVLPAFLIMTYVGLSDPVLSLCFFFAIGPAVTTILGQIGGAWGGRKSAERRNQQTGWKRRLASTSGWIPPWFRTSADGIEPEIAGHQRRVRFRITHLLWISVWLSVLLTAIRLAGIPFEYMLPLLGGWLVFQAFTLYAGAFLFGWLSRKRQARRRLLHVKQPAN